MKSFQEIQREDYLKRLQSCQFTVYAQQTCILAVTRPMNNAALVCIRQIGSVAVPLFSVDRLFVNIASNAVKKWNIFSPKCLVFSTLYLKIEWASVGDRNRRSISLQTVKYCAFMSYGHLIRPILFSFSSYLHLSSIISTPKEDTVIGAKEHQNIPCACRPL